MTEHPEDAAALDARLDEALDETFPASDPVAIHSVDVPALRSAVRCHAAHRDDIGNLTTRRPVPGPGLDRLGAFLFLNHHGPQNFAPGNEGLPFGPHPHRGFETITFILQGVLAHRDTAGHESIINAGGVQWMTAGSGLIHEEISPASFKRDGGPLEILQLWVNLPARLKKTPPRYVGVQRDAIPTIRADVFMATVELRAGGRVSFDNLAGRDVFLYAVRGDLNVAGTAVPAFNLVEFSEGAAVEIEASTQAVVLFGHADPINEPVVSHGPFVMNSTEEIRQAYADYRAGRFQIPG